MSQFSSNFFLQKFFPLNEVMSLCLSPYWFVGLSPSGFMISGFGLNPRVSCTCFLLLLGRILLEQCSPGRCKDLKLLRHAAHATCSHPCTDDNWQHQPSVLQVPAAVAEAQGAGVSASLCQSMGIWFLLPLDTLGIPLAVGGERVISFYHPNLLLPDMHSCL